MTSESSRFPDFSGCSQFSFAVFQVTICFSTSYPFVPQIGPETAGTFSPHHEDPVEFCSAPRRRLEDIESHEDLKAFWSRNDKRVEESRRTLPDLKTDKGKHYADILAALYQRRTEESAKREKIKKIQITDRRRVAADQRTEKDEPTRTRQEARLTNPSSPFPPSSAFGTKSIRARWPRGPASSAGGCRAKRIM